MTTALSSYTTSGDVTVLFASRGDGMVMLDTVEEAPDDDSEA